MSEPKMPRRRVRLTITVDADSWDDALDSAHRYLDTLERDTHWLEINRDADGVSSGYGSGRSYSLDVDTSAPVGVAYNAALEAWAKEVRND